MLQRTRLACFATLPDGYGFEATVAAAARAGFDEFAIWLLSIDRAREELGSLQAVADCLARHGMRASVLELLHAWSTGDAGAAREEREVMLAAAAVFKPDVILAATLVPHIEPGAATLLKAHCQALAPLRVALEFLPFGGLPTLSAARELVAEIDEPNLGFTLDSWHFARAGLDYAGLESLPGERIHFVQLNDAAIEPPADLFTETMTARLRPGEGVVDWPRFIGALETAGVSCPIGSEQYADVVKAMPLDEACRYLFESVQDIVANPHHKPRGAR